MLRIVGRLSHRASRVGSSVRPHTLCAGFQIQNFPSWSRCGSGIRTLTPQSSCLIRVGLNVGRHHSSRSATMSPYSGQCLCGAVRYRVNRRPLTLYACHCTDCQRRTGSAFALSMIVRREDLEVLDGRTTGYTARLPDGRTKAGQMCASCGTRLWGTPVKHPHVVVVQSGTLDQPCGLEPIAHQWLSEAQPWFTPPPGVAAYPKGPVDPSELVRLWQQHHDDA